MAAAFTLAVFTAALAGDDTTVDAELARDQVISSIFGDVVAGAVPFLCFTWWAGRCVVRIRRMNHVRRQAMARAVEDDIIKGHINTALATFRSTVVMPELTMLRDDISRALNTHSGEAAAQLKTVSLAVASVAKSVERIGDNVDTKVDAINGRIDNFLQAWASAMANGAPHYRRADPAMLVDGRRSSDPKERT